MESGGSRLKEREGVLEFRTLLKACFSLEEIQLQLPKHMRCREADVVAGGVGEVIPEREQLLSSLPVMADPDGQLDGI